MRKQYEHKLSHWVNARQTPEERRKKYYTLRKNGISRTLSLRARDWTWNHIKLLLTAEAEHQQQTTEDG